MTKLSHPGAFNLGHKRYASGEVTRRLEDRFVSNAFENVLSISLSRSAFAIRGNDSSRSATNRKIVSFVTKNGAEKAGVHLLHLIKGPINGSSRPASR